MYFPDHEFEIDERWFPALQEYLSRRHWGLVDEWLDKIINMTKSKLLDISPDLSVNLEFCESAGDADTLKRYPDRDDVEDVFLDALLSAYSIKEGLPCSSCQHYNEMKDARKKYSITDICKSCQKEPQDALVKDILIGVDELNTNLKLALSKVRNIEKDELIIKKQNQQKYLKRGGEHRRAIGIEQLVFDIVSTSKNKMSAQQIWNKILKKYLSLDRYEKGDYIIYKDGEKLCEYNNKTNQGKAITRTSFNRYVRNVKKPLNITK